jgi:thioredoxin:protein disulfide reductase
MRKTLRALKKPGNATRAAARVALCVAFGCVAAISAAAQKRPPVVHAHAVFATDGVHAGSSVKAAIVAEIASGFHINDHKPTLEYLIPTEVEFEPLPNFTMAKLLYPKGESKSFAFSDTQLSVYQGTIEVGALVSVARATRPGTYTLTGKFRYQACNEQACLPPTSVPVELTLKVVPRNVPVKPANTELFQQIKFE